MDFAHRIARISFSTPRSLRSGHYTMGIFLHGACSLEIRLFGTRKEIEDAAKKLRHVAEEFEGVKTGDFSTSIHEVCDLTAKPMRDRKGCEIVITTREAVREFHVFMGE